VWAIVEAITFTLNPIIFACVMNQIRGHWLLSDALTMAITSTMEMEAQLSELFVRPKISYFFEVEICLLHKNLWLEVIKVMKIFWKF
jgi:hypothetical protein